MYIYRLWDFWFAKCLGHLLSGTGCRGKVLLVCSPCGWGGMVCEIFNKVEVSD